MLQQTQVQTALPYFERWIGRFPTVQALAQADEQDVLSLWQGLGYYRRCRMMQQAARNIARDGMPHDAAGWRALPGVGRYTAAAIASICFGEAVPLVDGNVERVFARLTACGAEGPRLSKAAWAWASENLNHGRPGDHNQALMELGAMICRPSSPSCSRCPLEADCLAARMKRANEFPVARLNPQTVKLRQTVWIPYFNERFGVRQIQPGEWWHGLWEFVRLPHDAPCPFDRSEVVPLGVIRHTVTHHRIELSVRLCRLDRHADRLVWKSPREMESLPMPSSQRKALGLALSLIFGAPR